jgi:uncharacterized protein (TIRG00374 family)
MIDGEDDRKASEASEEPPEQYVNPFGETAVTEKTVEESAADTAFAAEGVSETKDERKKRMRKKTLGYAAFIGINALVIIILLLVQDKNGDTVAGREAFALLGKNFWYTLCAFSVFFFIIFLDVIVFWTLMRKLHIEKRSIATCINVSFLGRYYDRVTPWAMGGEPFQIFYLNKRGLSTGDSCAVTVSRHIIRFFTVAFAVIVILSASRISTNIYVMVAAIFSVLAGLVIPVFMLICAFNPKLGLKIGKGAINLLYKMKIVKNYDKAYEKMRDNVEQFLLGLKVLSMNRSLVFVIAVCALAEMFAYNSAPFFVMRALGVSTVPYWHTLVLCLFVNYASSFAPTPGGSGIAELSFYAIFAAYIGGGLLFWAVLFWRIAVFYIPVFIGFVMQIVSAVSGIVKAKRDYRKSY